MSALGAAIAATRFGMGARPGEIEAARSDPAGWLEAQLAAQDVRRLQGTAGAKDALQRFARYRDELSAVQAGEANDLDAADRQAILMELLQPRYAHVIRRTALSISTGSSFQERWIRFWSNHFSVGTNSLPMGALAPTLEAEVIRPQSLTGSFADLAVAAELHQAMLVYLDNQASVGPNSPAARVTGRGLNENHAREILELHTLGVNGGYDQDDVEALARLLTGWTIARPRFYEEARWGETIFDARLHEPGAQTVLGRRFSGEGARKVPAAIRFLAEQPQTRRFISEKLARHFFADQPGEAVIAHLEEAWRASGGDLMTIARALITAPGALSGEPMKFKAPEEYLISALRGIDAPLPSPRELARAFEAIGQAPFSAPSPAGWPDDEASWASPDAIKKRLEFANALAERTGGSGDPRAQAPEMLGARLTEGARVAVARAESAEQGLTLLLMAPEFLRR